MKMSKIIKKIVWLGVMMLATQPSFAKNKKFKQNNGIDNIVALSERLERENDPNYGDMYIQRKPKFQIVVLFADNQNRQAWLKSLSPKMRRHVVIRQAKKSRQQFLREQDELSETLRQAGVKEFVLRYDIELQKFLLDVGNHADRDTARQIADKLNHRDLAIKVGNLPVPERR